MGRGGVDLEWGARGRIPGRRRAPTRLVVVAALVAGTLSTLGAAGWSASAPAAAAPAPATPNGSVVAREVIQLVNAERAVRGLPTLTENATLDSAAQAIANNYPNGNGNASVAPYEPFGWHGGAIIEDYSTTQAFSSGGAVTQWLKSSYYVDQVLGGSANDPAGEIGVGVGCSPSGGEYIELATAWKTSTFGRPATQPASTVPVGTAVASCAGDPGGYYEVASDGGIFAFGDAQFFGSTGNIHLNQPIVGMSRTPDGKGYWEVASDGGIFAYGDARFFGSMGATHLNQPIVGMAATPDGNGYWLVAADGGIFAFGDAPFYGSTGNLHLNQPIVGMAPSPDGHGYWFVAADGGVFSYGDALFHGSAVGATSSPVVGMAAQGTGYLILERNGAVHGENATAVAPAVAGEDAVGIETSPADGFGSWTVTTNGAIGAEYDYANYNWGSMAGRPLNLPIVGMG